MRLDIFTKRTATHPLGPRDWSLYVAAVTPGNALRIVTALEKDGEYVGAFGAGGTLGLIKYETGHGWNK